jgi:hypothetical protein
MPWSAPAPVRRPAIRFARSCALKKGPDEGPPGPNAAAEQVRIEAVTRADESEQVRSAQQQPRWRRVRVFEKQGRRANGAIFYRTSDAVECSEPHPS